MNFSDMTALQLGQYLHQKEIAVGEVLDAVFEQIDKREEELHCYITLDREGVYRQAERIQSCILTGEIPSPLAGVPISVKDNLCTKGLRTTCGTAMLENFVPPYDASVVERLREAGMLIIGKTNMDEFAMGSTTETSYFGVTRNPTDPSHVPGGSSGGSAASVAAGEAFAALGTDTGGSVRQPAAYCGVYGFKPTYGTVSRYGLIAYASSLDQVGFFTKDAADSAALMQYTCIRDRKDATSVGLSDPGMLEKIWKAAISKERQNQGELFDESTANRMKGKRIGILKEIPGVNVAPAIQKAVREVGAIFEGMGAEVEEYEPTMWEYGLCAYYTIAPAEASSNLGRYDGVKYGLRKDREELHDMYLATRTAGFGEEVRRRILLGTFVLSRSYYDAYYQKAMKVRRLLTDELGRAFGRFDLLLGPVSQQTAPKLGVCLQDPVQMYLGDLFTTPANMAGMPAISIPCGCDEKGLPVGVQLMADRFRDKELLQTAYLCERKGISCRNTKQ